MRSLVLNYLLRIKMTQNNELVRVLPYYMRFIWCCVVRHVSKYLQSLCYLVLKIVDP